jgi:hypothetical protein
VKSGSLLSWRLIPPLMMTFLGEGLSYSIIVAAAASCITMQGL